MNDGTQEFLEQLYNATMDELHINIPAFRISWASPVQSIVCYCIKKIVNGTSTSEQDITQLVKDTGIYFNIEQKVSLAESVIKRAMKEQNVEFYINDAGNIRVKHCEE